jgi:hypothetical protein
METCMAAYRNAAAGKAEAPGLPCREAGRRPFRSLCETGRARRPSERRIARGGRPV